MHSLTMLLKMSLRTLSNAQSKSDCMFGLRKGVVWMYNPFFFLHLESVVLSNVSNSTLYLTVEYFQTFKAVSVFGNKFLLCF